VKGSDRGLIELLFQHLPGGIEKYYKKLSQDRQDGQCPGRDLKRAPPEYKSLGLMLYQPAIFFCLLL
jgi:hypothetical protein